MDALSPAPLKSDSTRALLGRLWREHGRNHRGRLAVILLLTLVMAGLTALSRCSPGGTSVSSTKFRCWS